MHVPLILAMLLLVVSSLQFNAKESTNASHLLVTKQPENVLLNKSFVMMEINAPLILAMLTLEIASTLPSTVMTTMHVPLILAIFPVEFAFTSVKSVTIKTYALSIAVTLALENVFSPTSLLN